MNYIAGIVGFFAESEALNIISSMTAKMNFRGSMDMPPILIRGNETSPIAVFSAGQFYKDDSRGLLLALEGEVYAVPDISHQKLKIFFEQRDKIGNDFPRHINGSYTAALWDYSSRTLNLVRDHVGCRSIYFAQIKNGVIFASTVAAILASGMVESSINPCSVDAYFGVKALSPPETMYKNISALRPGHILIWENGEFHQYDYWRLHEISESRDALKKHLIAELQSIIKDAVRIRQQAGGHYCALVSGGVDTSAIATILSGLPGTPPLRGLSIAFDEIAYSDADLQDIIVKSLGIDQQERVLKADEFAKTLTKAVAFLDSPVNDVAFVGMYTAFGMAKDNGYDIVFDGEGPDELFPAGNTQGERGIGFLLHLPQQLRRLLFGIVATSIPLGNSKVNKIQRMCARLALANDERRLTWRPIYHTKARKALLNSHYCTGVDPYAVGKDYLAQTALQDKLNIYQYGLIKTFLPDDLLYKNERMAAAHNIINRTPLVDYRLVELALKIPSRYQIEKPTLKTDGIKLLYKSALRGIVPKEILNRKKERGFSQPTQLWFAGALKEFVYDTILGEKATSRGMFNPVFLNRLFSEHVSGKVNHDAFLTSIIIFNLWMSAQKK